LFKKRFTLLSSTVVTNRIWLKSSNNRTCDVLITFSPTESYETIFTILQVLLKEKQLIINVNYHHTSHSIAFYVTATYERLLHGAEEFQLKKGIKLKYGGGSKEFIFAEQEFYENIENEDLFFSTQEKQFIINELLNQLRCGNRDNHLNNIGDIEINGKK
jgi:hypothetical protein